MQLTPEQKTIIDFIEQTNVPIFLTGKAGSGKTTFLQYIKSNVQKNLAVVAPTAVAAVNAGGVTIHSFFQAPFGPLIPFTEDEFFAEFTRKRISQEKIRLIKCLELLIIDEISMVRADLLDYIDAVLRYIKGTERPFGGVQVLMIGDLYQLPPVFQTDWPLLKKHYSTPFFFGSLVFQKQPVLTFELTEVFRQKDPEFIQILNGIRSGHIHDELLEQLNRRAIKPEFAYQGDGYVTLTTHNALVKTTNESHLAELSGETYLFKATIGGDFPKDAYPGEESLLLKIGAQVMFIKNDTSGKKQYYNGRTAKIASIGGQNITVIFLDDQSELKINQETWQNVKYAVSDKESKLKESNAGSFTQFPLRLAWAITIHKSQGLTFEKAIIDVNSAFAAGQTYVALSRCRNLEGLILKQPVRAENITTDPQIVAFMDNVAIPDVTFLNTYASNLDFQVVEDLFDFSSAISAWNFIRPILADQQSAKPILEKKIIKTNDYLADKIKLVADRFKRQELARIAGNKSFWEMQAFTDRLCKASEYFVPVLNALDQDLGDLHTHVLGTELSDEYYAGLNQLMSQLKMKVAGFSTLPKARNSRAISEAMVYQTLAYRPLQHNRNVPGTEKTVIVNNPILYQELINWRGTLSRQRQQPDYTVISEKVLREVATKMPRSLSQLSAIKNFGELKAKDFGGQILEIIQQFDGNKPLF